MARSRTSYPPGITGNPKGGATKTLTVDGYALVTKLMSLDKSESTVWRALGISGPTWYAMKKRDAKLVDAIEYGRGLARDKYVAALQRHGKRNFVANIFLLKGLHGVTEGGQADQGPTNITIHIAGAASLAEYKPPKLIEGKLVDD